jgi:galactokinase
VAATEQGFALAAVPREDELVRMVDARTGQKDEFSFARIEPRPGHWSNYWRVVAGRMMRDLPGRWRGADVAFVSDLPPAAGLSSSSALVIGAALALGDANHLAERPEYRENLCAVLDRAAWLGAVENGRPFRGFEGGGGVGTLGGNQDQTAILASAPGALLRLRFDPMTIESEVPFPDDLTFAIGVCGVTAHKTGSALGLYNAVAERTARLWELVRDVAPDRAGSLGAAMLHGPDAADRLRRRLGERLPDARERAPFEARLEQLMTECLDLIPALEAAVRAGDHAAIGRVAARSQAGAEAALENQIPETIALVELALAAGAIGASAFGAGFGGSVWALVPREESPSFLARWQTLYERRFPVHRETARFVLTRPAMPATRI